MACCSAPSLVREHSLEDDPVLKDLKDFDERELGGASGSGTSGDGSGEGSGEGSGDGSRGGGSKVNGFENKVLLGGVIVVVMMLVLWYLA